MFRRPGGPTYEAIVDEVAVRRLCAPPDVVKKQLYHLATTVNGDPKITLRVLPVDARIQDFSLPRCTFSIYAYPDAGRSGRRCHRHCHRRPDSHRARRSRNHTNICTHGCAMRHFLPQIASICSPRPQPTSQITRSKEMPVMSDGKYAGWRKSSYSGTGNCVEVRFRAAQASDSDGR